MARSALTCQAARMRRLAPLLALLVIALFAFAGCGGDDNDDGDSGSSTPAATATTDDSGSEDTTSTEDDTGGATVPEDTPDSVDEAIQRCNDAIDANTMLSDKSKDRLKDLCSEAASGDADRLKDIAKEACRAVVEESLPEGEARDQALEQCETAGG
jgi:hypothetical protein